MARHAADLAALPAAELASRLGRAMSAHAPAGTIPPRELLAEAVLRELRNHRRP